jgi:primosomal protein N' (replication factor Y)
MDQYVEVILPLPIPRTFTYRLPPVLAGNMAVGYRVIVPFGKRKYYTGIVVNITNVAPTDYEVKDVVHVPDNHPIVRHPQLKLWEWTASYYMCAVGDVYKAAIPSGLKVESETRVEANPDFEDDMADSLTERERAVWSVLVVKGKLSPGELSKETGIKNIEPLVSKLIEKGAAVISEKLVERYRALKERYVKIAAERDNPDDLHRLFDAVKGAKKQEQLLMTALKMSRFVNRGEPLVEMKRNDLLDAAGVTAPILQAMVKKGVLEGYTRVTERFRYDGPPGGELPALTEAQQKALTEVFAAFKEHAVTLLHGVTSSGKTEIYMRLIDHVLKQGLQVLYLVPEIALTTQLTDRLQRVFGSQVTVYHSRFSDARRVETWNELLRSGEPRVIIGARSTTFLPFAKLGLVIVDEEHEQSYKQFDPAPRYSGRDLAIVLASMHGAKTLLGSATPSVETYYKCLHNKYGLVTLSERYEGISLPVINVVDMKLARQKGRIDGAFSADAMQYMSQALGNGEQAIIFHNRRGYAPRAVCRRCAWVPKCEHCDVSLTWHRHSHSLVCHYCGSRYDLPQRCPQCGDTAIEIEGYGTERVEEDIEKKFGTYKILRLDLDTTRNKDDYQTIIEDFSNHRADILIGTQMVSKGLDFGGVSTVTVLNADNIINYPDFRASERAYNMLEQVAGRAGRRQTRGMVIIQTWNPEHPVLKYLATHDYNAYYEHEIDERRRFNYPPFARIIYIYIKHRDERQVASIAEIYGAELRRLFGNRVFGPDAPGISRIQAMYIRKIMLKIEPNASVAAVKELLINLQDAYSVRPDMRSAVIYYDVDPQ